MINTKKYKIWFYFCIMLCLMLLFVFTSCNNNSNKTHENDVSVLEANELIVDSKSENDTKFNSEYLQKLIDEASTKGCTVKLPAGSFYFSKTADVCNNEEHYCIKCKDNVNLVGEGIKTILYPIGYLGPDIQGGIDMFFYNEYRESNFTNPQFLENANFSNFVIDGSNTKISNYNTSGKGFMINLFKDCNFENLIVRNIDATGIGIDCPINSKISNCITDNCGKAGDLHSEGASGIGIGYGYSSDESIEINNCQCISNDKFGIFFEWQGCWSEKHAKWYSHKDHKEFKVNNCYCAYNRCADIGGLASHNVNYNNCLYNTEYFGKNSSNNEISNN